MRTSFFFDLKRKNVMSFVGSRSRIVDLAWKTFFFSLEKVQFKFVTQYLLDLSKIVHTGQSFSKHFVFPFSIVLKFLSNFLVVQVICTQLLVLSFHSWRSIYIKIQKKLLYIFGYKSDALKSNDLQSKPQLIYLCPI